MEIMKFSATPLALAPASYKPAPKCVIHGAAVDANSLGPFLAPRLYSSDTDTEAPLSPSSATEAKMASRVAASSVAPSPSPRPPR